MGAGRPGAGGVRQARESETGGPVGSLGGCAGHRLPAGSCPPCLQGCSKHRLAAQTQCPSLPRGSLGMALPPGAASVERIPRGSLAGGLGS